MPGARLVDYTDQEFLHVLDDVADNDGFATSFEIAEKLGISKNGQKGTPAQNVGVRLAWMKRIGFVSNEYVTIRDNGSEGHTVAMWQITARGRLFLDAKLTPQQQRVLNVLKKEESLDVLAILGRRFLSNGDQMTRQALRREFAYYTFTGKRVRGRRR